MNDLTSKMRTVAKELLEKGEVKYVIGWEKGTLFFQSPPVFIDRPEDADRLVWDEFCLANLGIYLLDDRYGEGKIGVFAKGCDSRGIVRIIQDKQFPRERVYIIGIPCSGLKDPDKALELGSKEEAPAASKCTLCTHRNPVIYDTMIGEPVPETEPKNKFEAVTELEKLTPDERYEYWVRQYSRCLRCFACRNVCPACNCTECMFDQTAVGWLPKLVGNAENQFYGLVRAFHVAGRCVECGECERVCPVNIPIMSVNLKIIKDINELFGPYEAGVDLEQVPPLMTYNPDDPEEFE